MESYGTVQTLYMPFTSIQLDIAIMGDELNIIEIHRWKGKFILSVKRFKHTCLQQVQSVISMKIAISLAFGQMATTNCMESCDTGIGTSVSGTPDLSTSVECEHYASRNSFSWQGNNYVSTARPRGCFRDSLHLVLQ